jgi:hypothetical protein
MEVIGLQDFMSNTLDGRSAVDLNEFQTGELTQAIRKLCARSQVFSHQNPQALEGHI